jgi:hypothetical protein
VTETQTFDPTACETFRFTARSLSPEGRVELRYALDDEHEFVERYELPVPDGGTIDPDAAEPLLALLHWVAGVSYYKAALPPRIALETGAPPPATARLLEGVYSEGLGELAAVNDLAALPRPSFEPGEPPGRPAPEPPPRRVLVPVGGGKDSAVALEIVRRSGLELALFSVGDAAPIRRTAEVAGLPRLIVGREIDAHLLELNRAGAINGHVPVTVIVAAAAALTAALHGFDVVAFANERAASAGNFAWKGVEVNHQYAKSLAVEALMRDALAELVGSPQVFSVLRPASELSIARAFARLPRYHGAIVSCNGVFRLDPELRAASWCGECDKCRFVFLALAPFMEPAQLEAMFGRAMLDEPDQYEGFALLTAIGGPKPFECVGEVEESVAAIRLLARNPRWRDQAVVRRLAGEVLPRFGDDEGQPAALMGLSDEHFVPAALMDDVNALLGA